MTTTETTPCPCCKGVGRFDVASLVWNHETRQHDKVWECERCKGTGTESTWKT